MEHKVVEDLLDNLAERMFNEWKGSESDNSIYSWLAQVYMTLLFLFYIEIILIVECLL